MTTHELYINDMLIDIDKDVNIYPTFQSPIFTDLKYITSNITNNISLPITANNARAIEMYHLADKSDPVSATKTFPRRWHNVRYYRNGLEICKSALGKIIGIDNGRINFAFTWGNIENFSLLFDKNLRDLKCNINIPWNKGVKYETNFDKDYCFYNIDFGAGVTNRRPNVLDNMGLQYQHPLVKSNFIISKIAEENGIIIKNTKNNKLLTDDYLIPCIGKNSNMACNEYSSYFSMSNVIETVQVDSTKKAFIHPSIPSEADMGDPLLLFFQDPIDLWNDVDKCFDVKDVDKIRLIIQEFTLHCNKWEGIDYPNFAIELGKDIKIQYKDKVPNELGGYNYIFTNIDLEIDVKNIEKLKICLGDIKEKSSGGKQYTQLPIFLNLMSPQIRVIPYLKEVIFSPKDYSMIHFPLMENLPDMTQAEFLHSIMRMNGLFAYIKEERIIDFLSIDDIIENIPNALDWSDRLVNGSLNYNAPDNIEFEFLDFERQNKFNYDNDSDVKKDYSASLFIDNETIKDGKDKDGVKLPFSPSNNVKSFGEVISINNGRTVCNTFYQAQIPLYDVSFDAENVKEVSFNDSVKPRILTFRKQLNDPVISFDGLEWKNILANKYNAYKKIIKNPRVLKIDCNLSDCDISKIDFSIPIWFSQFGNHYAVISIQTAANGISKCIFLEIKPDIKNIPGFPGML